MALLEYLYMIYQSIHLYWYTKQGILANQKNGKGFISLSIFKANNNNLTVK